MFRKLVSSGALVILTLAVAATTSGQKDKGKKPEPKVVMVLPLAVSAGQTAKVTVRGLELDKATAIHFASDKIKVKILSKGKADVPDKNPQQAGDTQFTVEFMVPKDLPGNELSFEVETPVGRTKPHKILLAGTLPVVQQKEPNDGFATAQKVPVPVAVDGTIDRGGDVDVYAIEGKAGQKLEFEILAQRFGSVLDSMLTIYGDKGEPLAFGKYIADSTDCRAVVTLPRNGTYYVSVIDAHDRGGPTYPYRLTIQNAK